MEIFGTVFGFIVILLVMYFASRYDNRKAAEEEERLDRLERDSERKWEDLSDDGVAKAQTSFERELERDVNLPDGISGRGAYVYWNLMAPWFSDLSVSTRYTAGHEKLKSDWMSYMAALKEHHGYGYLESEYVGDDPKKADEYGSIAAKAAKITSTIEDAFAAAKGQKAIDELQRIRNAPFGAFDQSGKKPMAPAGYRYMPIPGQWPGERLISWPPSGGRKRKRKKKKRTVSAPS